MDDEEDLLNIDLNTSPSFDVSSTLQAKSSPQHTNATTAKPPSGEQRASMVSQRPKKIEQVSWLQGGNNETSQRELIQRQMAMKRQEEHGGEPPTPVMIQGDSFGSDEGETGLTIKDKLRKTAVAVTGSTIVASGTVMLITPAHPFGHAVQAAGLGVLATEFDGAKRVKDRASALIKKRLSGKSKPALQDSKKSEPLPLGPSPLQDTSDLQRSFASTSYVSPFRKTSVPPNAKDPNQDAKATKPNVETSIPKATLNRQGSTSLSEVIPVSAMHSKSKSAKTKAKKTIPAPTLNRQGSTSLSGGI